jgi:hypothetical protein
VRLKQELKRDIKRAKNLPKSRLCQKARAKGIRGGSAAGSWRGYCESVRSSRGRRGDS